MKQVYYLFILLIFCSCIESNRARISRLVKEWEGREIIIPENLIFTKYDVDTINYQLKKSDYAIVSYIDSVGCTSCKLQFRRWRQIMNEMDSLSETSIPFLFIFHPKAVKDGLELSRLMKRDHFDYPVCIDRNDIFNKKNKFPVEDMFHTMLVDKQNKVLAIGNPFQNPRIKELYLNIICENSKQSGSFLNITGLTVEQQIIDLGEFDWTISQEVVFKLNNISNNRIMINDIVTSCGCMAVEYLQRPIESGEKLLIKVTYKAEKPEFFNKKLTVYLNSEEPLQLTVRGHAL